MVHGRPRPVFQVDGRVENSIDKSDAGVLQQLAESESQVVHKTVSEV